MEVSDSSIQPITIVSFRISGSELDPNKVSQVLGLVPDNAHLKGEQPKDPRRSAYKQGLWGLRSKLSNEDPLSAHLESLLAILEPSQEQILKLSEQNTVDFYCSLYSQNGFQLSPHLLRQTANLGAGFGVDVYPPDEGSEDDASPTELA